MSLWSYVGKQVYNLHSYLHIHLILTQLNNPFMHWRSGCEDIKILQKAVSIRMIMKSLYGWRWDLLWKKRMPVDILKLQTLKTVKKASSVIFILTHHQHYYLMKLTKLMKLLKPQQLVFASVTGSTPRLRIVGDATVHHTVSSAIATPTRLPAPSTAPSPLYGSQPPLWLPAPSRAWQLLYIGSRWVQLCWTKQGFKDSPLWPVC